MRVLIATTQVPFVRGGAELHAEGLRDALREGGHQAEIVAIPFKWYPPESILSHMAACRVLDLSEMGGTSIDRVIGLKFPAYYVRHPNKVLWILHQHRQAYELWGHPLSDLHLYENGEKVREAIRSADRRLIPEARAVFANSRRVAERLKAGCGIDAEPLYHPPYNAGRFYNAEAEDYILFPSRVSEWKRQALVVEALAHTRQPVRVRFLGPFDQGPYMEEMRRDASRLGVDRRIEWLGSVPEEEKLKQYAHALAVVFPPVDEDYGYITLEAMLSSKPVVTCTDSGGPLELVRDGETGYITEPTPQAVASALDRLWSDRSRAAAMGKRARELYESLNISWENVVRKLLA